MSIILASKSPRRQELLKKVVNDFIVVTSNAKEVIDYSLTVEKIAESIAATKAEYIYQDYQNDLIISADTIVVIDNNILGKPKTEKDAFDMLSMLSNKTHKVITGVCIIYKNKTYKFHSTTKVTFYKLTPKQINDYIATKSPFDKAGGYGIQDDAALFVKKIDGDYYNVMGLPIAKLNKFLNKIF